MDQEVRVKMEEVNIVDEQDVNQEESIAVNTDSVSAVDGRTAELDRQLIASLTNTSRRSRQTYNKNGKFIRH